MGRRLRPQRCRQHLFYETSSLWLLKPREPREKGSPQQALRTRAQGGDEAPKLAAEEKLKHWP